MEALELVLFLLAAVVISSIIDRLIPAFSLPLIQIAFGAVIAFFISTPFSGGINSELLLILFIAPLHFNESRHADSGMLWRNRWGIISLSIGLVVAIVISVGFTLHALLPMVPIALALAMGAAFGSTDAVAVHSLSKGYRFGRHHEALLTGEALFNDVTGTVIFQCAIAIAVSGTFSLTHAGEEFISDLFGGLLGGAIMGVLIWFLLELIKKHGIDNPTLHVTLELLTPFLVYLIAEHIHIGGIIAVVASGLIMSLLPHKHNAQSAKQKLQSQSVWNIIEFILNGIIFVILGMQLPRLFEPATNGEVGDPLLILGAIIVLSCVLELVRFIWILFMDMVHAKRQDERVSDCFKAKSIKGTLAMAFAGAKGGITLSLMLTVPMTLGSGDAFPARDAVISIASGVVLLSLLFADFGVPLLVPHKQEAKQTEERIDAEISIIGQTILSIQADSHLTGNVRWESTGDSEPAFGTDASAFDKGSAGRDDAHTLNGDPVFIDEPATVIVMKRYSDQLVDLIPLASGDVAEKARKLVAYCDDLYERIDEISKDAYEHMDDYGIDDEDVGEDGDSVRVLDEDDDSDDSSRLGSRFKELRAIYEAVEDIQSQSLARELEIIKEMRTSGKITGDHAKQLRNDVYIQQLTI